MAKGWTHLSMALVGLLGAGLIVCQTLKAWPEQTPQSEPPAAERPVLEGDKSARMDLYGDPLPVGALVRLGTTRLRHREQAGQVLFAPDGEMHAFRQVWKGPAEIVEHISQADQGLCGVHITKV